MSGQRSHFSDPTRRFFFLCGNTHDEFWPADLRRLTLEQMLLRHLQSLGYRRIVYVDPSSRICFWDRRSYALCLPPDARPGPSANAAHPSDAARLIPPGPLGRGPLLVRRRSSATAPGATESSASADSDRNPALLSKPFTPYGAMSDSGVVSRIVDLLLTPDQPETAVIFTNSLNMLAHFGQLDPSALGQLTHAFNRLATAPADNRNICCFIFQKSTPEAISEQFERNQSWQWLRNFLLSRNEPGKATITLGPPFRDEIAAIVHCHRLREQIPVEWESLPITLDNLARHWRCRPGTAKEFHNEIRGLLDRPGGSIDCEALGSLVRRHPRGTALERLRAMRGMDPVIRRVEDWLREFEEKTTERAKSTGNPPPSPDQPPGSFIERILPQPGADLGMNLHLVLTGRPGTGKSTVARLIAEVFAENGLLPSGHLVEVQRADLVAGYVGQTAMKTMDVIESAMGGMLFIDEAYSLARGDDGGPDSFGQEAVDVINKAMEDRNGQFSLVVAGYSDEMDTFLQANPGLASRFGEGNRIEIPEQDAATLQAIFEEHAADSGRRIADELQQALPGFFRNWWRSNHRKRDFGFARDIVKTLIPGFDSARGRRASSLPADDPARREFSLADVPEAFRHYLPGERQDDLAGLLAQLDAMEGLDAVKEKVRQIIALAKYQKTHRPDTPPNPGHYVFEGSPGTGKTTVARLMGRMLAALELLDRAEVIETDAGKITAAHDPLAFLRGRFEAALGGVLFIDEAYGLAPAAEGDGRQLLIDSLPTLLLDHAHEMSVIVAGYTADMERLLDSNPGLPSRFPEDNRLVFNDFTPEQLLRIFRSMAEKKGFSVPETLHPPLRACFQRRREENREKYGNARDVENMLSEMEKHFALRAMNNPDIERAFILQDVPTQQRRPIDEEGLRQAMEHLDRLTGLKSVKDAVRRWESKVRSAIKRGDDAVIAPGHFAFVGNPGTGKTTVARLLGDIMRALGLLGNGEVREVGRGDLVGAYQGHTLKKTREVCSEALGNVLFLDEAYSLVQDDGDTYGREALDELLRFVDNNRQRMSFVIAGYPDDIRRFIERNPGMSRRVPTRLVFEDYTPEELVEIFTGMAADRRFNLTGSAREKLHLIFDRMVREADRNFGNAGEARNLLEATIERQSSRLEQLGEVADLDSRYFVIEPEDLQEIDTRAERERAYCEVRSKLDALIGLGSVKKVVDELRGGFKLRQKQGDHARGDLVPGHYAFIGNPGTGKTQVANLFGKLLYGIGLLKRGHTVVVSRADLVAAFEGQTAIKTNARIDEAMDGVLFIDEAYSLVKDEQDSFGKEALDILIARMENNRRRLCVIMAGYTTQMRQLIEKNAGLKSRITKEILFPDYSAEELVRIFKKIAQDRGYELGEGSDARLCRQFEELRRSSAEAFGNARQAVNVLKSACERMSARLQGELDDIPEGDPRLFRIEAEDIAEPESEILLETALEPLDRLVGLGVLKRQVREWAEYMQTERWKGDAGEPPAPGHYLFVGNPGTGKTTVARLMGGILKSIGCLKGGHVVEVKRADLVAGYVGQTAIKSMERLKDALGGVLFLDEAYSLVQGEQDSYGREALDTLLAYMEDHRDNLCVVFAGYPGPIEALVRSNPGLTSRFDRTFVFENYSPAEMVEIFGRMAEERKLTLAPEVPDALLRTFTAWTSVNDPHFGNAREVRKLFDAARRGIATRVMRETGGRRPDDLAVLSRLTVADIQSTTPTPESSSESSTARSPLTRMSRRSLPAEYGDILPDPAEPPPDASGPQFSMESVRRIAPAVMFLEIVDRKGQRGSGTGFLITADGLALTCSHVAGEAGSMRARFDHRPGEWFEVTLVAADAEADLALVRVKDGPRRPVVLAAPSTTAPLGEAVGLLGYLLGEELGAEITFTKGEINSTRRQREVRHYQLSAGAGPGNSGGPLFRLSDGHVIGVLSGGIERTANAAINLAVDIREFFDRLTVTEPEAPPVQTQEQAQQKPVRRRRKTHDQS